MGRGATSTNSILYGRPSYRQRDPGYELKVEPDYVFIYDRGPRARSAARAAVDRYQLTPVIDCLLEVASGSGPRFPYFGNAEIRNPGDNFSIARAADPAWLEFSWDEREWSWEADQGRAPWGKCRRVSIYLHRDDVPPLARALRPLAIDCRWTHVLLAAPRAAGFAVANGASQPIALDAEAVQAHAEEDTPGKLITDPTVLAELFD